MTEHEMRQDIKDIKLKLSTKDYRTRVIEKSKAVAFIKSANKKTYGKRLSTIHDQHSFKIDVYPKTLADAYDYSYFMLTRANLDNFSKMEIEGVDRAKRLHRAMGYPSYRKFLWLLQHNMIRNSKVTLDDVKRALHIYGEDPALIKGKTVKRKQSKA